MYSNSEMTFLVFGIASLLVLSNLYQKSQQEKLKKGTVTIEEWDAAKQRWIPIYG